MINVYFINDSFTSLKYNFIFNNSITNYSYNNDSSDSIINIYVKYIFNDEAQTISKKLGYFNFYKDSNFTQSISLPLTLLKTNIIYSTKLFNRFIQILYIY